MSNLSKETLAAAEAAGLVSRREDGELMFGRTHTFRLAYGIMQNLPPQTQVPRSRLRSSTDAPSRGLNQ